MNEILDQIGMSRAKSTMLEVTEPGAANLLRMNANMMEELLAVVESAKTLRDHCIDHSGTPPATYVCELDDDLRELEAGELEEAIATGPCKHNDWYEISGWRYCRQCIRHWDAEFMYESAVAAGEAISGEWNEDYNCFGPTAEAALTVKQTEEANVDVRLARAAAASKVFRAIYSKQKAEELETLTKRNKLLEAVSKAARAFIDQYSYVISNPEYTDVWRSLSAFGNAYTGPLFADPYTLRGALEKVELSADPTEGPTENCPVVCQYYDEKCEQCPDE